MKIPSFVFVLLIAALGLMAYFNSFSGQFVWDDTLLVQDSPHIKDARFLAKIFAEDLFYMTDEATGYYRPIQTISYMADHFLWGYMTLGYHITNFLIQIFNSSMVFFICLLLLKDKIKSFLVAAVFCIHPAFVAVVTYISGRADLLGMAFSLLAIYAVLRYIVNGKGIAAAWLSVPFYALAVISKEYYLITPFFILLFLFAYRGIYRTDSTVKSALTGMFLAAIVYAALRATALNFHQEMGVIAEQSFITRLAIFPWIVARYVGTLILPIDLGMEKRLEYGSLVEGRFVVSYVVVFLIAGALYYFNKTKKREALFFLGWFAVGIIPVSNLFVPLKAILADHWTYMASIGIFAVLAVVIGYSKRSVAAKISAPITVVFFIALVTVTIMENKYWQGEDVLYARILQKNPHSSRTVYNTARQAEEKGDYQKALELYLQAIEGTKTGRGLYFNSRGLLYKKMGDIQNAKNDFEEAVKASPSVAVYHNNLGCSYAELGMTDKARAEWEVTLKIAPGDKLATDNLQILRSS